MKKFILPIIIIFIIFIFSFNIPKDDKTEKIKKVDELKEQENIKEQNNFDNLMKNYDNRNILAFVEIPNVLLEPIVQADDNEYYLNYNINNEKDINGATFLDYRINIDNSNKILIYGHSDKSKTLPFTKLSNYKDKDFFIKNPYIYLYTKDNNYKFKIFSTYIETSDFDYLNIESFNGLTWLEHLKKLKNKSFYETNVEVEDNKKIIILQTCSFDNEYKNYSQKYHLVMGIST